MEKNGGKIGNSGRSEKRWKTRRCSGNDYLLKRKTRMEGWMLCVGERERGERNGRKIRKNAAKRIRGKGEDGKGREGIELK